MVRPGYSVIDKAISENRPSEILLYIISALIVGVGLFVIVYGGVKGNGWVALCGSIPTGMIFPCVYFARDIRKQNMAIRLLELTLDGTETPEEVAKAIGVLISG